MSARDESPSELDDLLDREALRDLVVRYALAVDEHDLDTLATMFAPDATFDRDGHLARGWPEIEEMLAASMQGFCWMRHVQHANLVELTGPDHARGRSTGDAELVTRRRVYLAAYRYTDEYTRLADRWVFGARVVSFRYATPAAEYATTLPAADPVRFPGEPPRSGPAAGLLGGADR